MKNKPDNAILPALPLAEEARPGIWNHAPFFGLTKREYIATHILSGMSTPTNNKLIALCTEMVTESIRLADELLKQLKEKDEKPPVL